MSEQFDADALLRAAQRQVEQLQAEVSRGREAQQEIARAQRFTKIQVRILGALAVVLLVIVGVLGAFGSQQQDLYSKLHSNQINSCEAGNVQRANERQVWDSFIDLILQGNHNPADQEKGKQFKAFINQIEGPRDCQKAYSTAVNMDDGGPSVVSAGS